MSNEMWTVTQGTGQRLDLERGLERKEVRRPKDPAKRHIFLSIRPGQMIYDATIKTFLSS